MKNAGNEAAVYTIERKFLARISAAELVGRILRTHIESENQKKAAAT